MVAALFLLSAGLLGIGGKLFWIQVVAARDYSDRHVDLVRNSVLQRQRGLVLDAGRGEFADRTGVPLTGRSIKGALVFPVRSGYEGTPEMRRRMLKVLGAADTDWRSFATALKEPAWWPDEEGKPLALTDAQAAKLESLQLPNVRVAELHIRYPGDMTARQAIGFVGQNPELVQNVFQDQLEQGRLQLDSQIGAAGLEKTFEPWLRALSPTTISYFTDAGKRPLQGLDTRLVAGNSAHYPVTVRTTLDAELQRVIERRMEGLGIQEGAVVVLDANNADVLAMASRPSYDPNHIDMAAGGWRNRAVLQTEPGSIFKTVIAAAALEAGVVKENETFDCKGELGKYGFRCWYAPGHGSITLEQAFAESCNITFAKVMMRLTPEQVEETARKLGLLGTVGWEGRVSGGGQLAQFDGEQAGQLFAPGTPQQDEGVRMQTAIGQRDVRVTPLQAANMIVTLLHGGRVSEPRIVTGIDLKDGKTLESFAERTKLPSGSGISPSTARKLLAWMREVVEEGTGTSLLKAKWPVAGKSGTAQVRTGANAADNHWFIGYAPVNAPKVAIAVLMADVPAGQPGRAQDLFKDVAELAVGRVGARS
jgi:cell division protein FtsI/penicillin-binding protein 2